MKSVLLQWQGRVKQKEEELRAWVSAQPAAVEVAFTTLTNGAQGGFIGGMMGMVTGDMATSLPQQPGMAAPETQAAMSSLKAMAASPWVQARNFAVMTGVNAGITAAMKRYRGGIEDIQTNMGAAFGSGFAFSLVSGMGGPNTLSSAVSTGFAFALFQGAIFQVGKKFTQPPVEDVRYAKTRGMLQSLGMEKYVKNFKKGLLTDETLPLMNERSLESVQIPPGPRLLILDHIKRTELSK